MLILAGGDIVGVEGVRHGASLVVEGGRIAEIADRVARPGPGVELIDGTGCLVVPGFVDVHVHGFGGHDVLDGTEALDAIARELPRFGVTSFCPTTIACRPAALANTLAAVAGLRGVQGHGRARVLPAHLESNFIEPAYRGAQPAACLCRPPSMGSPEAAGDERAASTGGEVDGNAILGVIEAHRPHVGIVTIAPELPGGLDLTRSLTSTGVRVSLGHSGATYDEALAAVDAGATRATHLFNRMSGFSHRRPGLVGAVLESERLAAEIICDGVHVHPAAVRVALSAKGAARTMAITDGTAGAGLPPGSRTRLGGLDVTVRDGAVYLDDDTLAGSVATMDAAFRWLVDVVGVGPSDAVGLCATTPARELGLTDFGEIRVGAVADLVVLGRGLEVRRTYVAGVLAYAVDA